MINFCNAGASKTQSLELQRMAASRGRGRLSRIGWLAGWVGIILMGLAFCPGAKAAGAAYVSWSGSSDPSVTGYNIYYGGASGVYTNEISVGNVTNAAVSNLSPGVTYYFAATAVGANGAESGYSAEVSFTAPSGSAAAGTLQINRVSGGGIQLAFAGVASHSYEILASTNLITWTVIGTQTADSSGALQFADGSAGSFPMRFYRTLDTQQ